MTRHDEEWLDDILDAIGAIDEAVVTERLAPLRADVLRLRELNTGNGRPEFF